METTSLPTAVFALLVMWAFVGPLAGGFISVQLDTSWLERWRKREWAQAVRDAKWVIVTRSTGSPTTDDPTDRYASSYVTASDEVSVQLRHVAERRGMKKVLSIVQVGKLKVGDEDFEKKLQDLTSKAYNMQVSLATTGVGT